MTWQFPLDLNPHALAPTLRPPARWGGYPLLGFAARLRAGSGLGWTGFGRMAGFQSGDKWRWSSASRQMGDNIFDGHICNKIGFCDLFFAYAIQ